MENISRGPISGIFSLSSQRGRCRTTRLQDYRVREYRLSSPSTIVNVMYCVRVSLRTVKIFLAPYFSEGGRVVDNLYIPLNGQYSYI
jgi:hypothetical protein